MLICGLVCHEEGEEEGRSDCNVLCLVYHKEEGERKTERRRPVETTTTNNDKKKKKRMTEEEKVCGLFSL